MKKLLCIALVLTLVGCATRTAYNTLATVGYTVDSAVSGYFSSVISGVVSTNGVPKVSKAYNVFQADYRIALQAAHGNTNSAAPIDILTSEKNVLDTIGGAK